jgi:hypothetical protein
MPTSAILFLIVYCIPTTPYLVVAGFGVLCGIMGIMLTILWVGIGVGLVQDIYDMIVAWSRRGPENNERN